MSRRSGTPFLSEPTVGRRSRWLRQLEAKQQARPTRIGVAIMHVVIDTNVICSDFQLSGAAFRTLFDWLRRTCHRLHVPQLVIDEARNVYGREMRDCKQHIEKQVRTLKRISGQSYDNPLSDEAIEDETRRYGEMLRYRLRQAASEIIKYPDAPHEVAAQRAMKRKRPFRGAGQRGKRAVTGYRDYLIWENVLTVARDTLEEVAFITGNRKDFGDNEGRLHPDFVEDLKVKGLSVDCVVLYWSLREFVDQQVKPTLVSLEAVRQKLADGEYPGLDLEQTLLEQAIGFLEGQELDPRDIWGPTSFESPSITWIDEISALEVVEVRGLSSSELLVRLTFDADCSFDVFIPKFEYYWMIDHPGHWSIFIIDPDWNKYYVFAGARASLQIEADAMVSLDTLTLSSLEMVSITGLGL